jgi:hypothetical protein
LKRIVWRNLTPELHRFVVFQKSLVVTVILGIKLMIKDVERLNSEILLKGRMMGRELKRSNFWKWFWKDYVILLRMMEWFRSGSVTVLRMIKWFEKITW